MKILLVKLKLIGDALLLTGSVRALKLARPDAEIHVVVRKGTEGILAGCPEITAVHTAGDKAGGKLARLRRDIALIRRLRAEKFDHAVELGDGDRGRILALLSGAPRRYANAAAIRSSFWKMMMTDARPIPRDYRHASQWDTDTLRLLVPEMMAEEHAPIFEKSHADFSVVDSLVPNQSPVFIHPVASRPGKLWTAAGWIAVARAALEQNRTVILSSGPAAHEIALCREIAAEVNDPGVIMAASPLNWTQVAGVLYRSTAYIGTDTAAMHLAAACDIPVVALFAHPPESRPELWRPLCRKSRILMTDDESVALTSLSPERVIKAMRDILADTPVSAPRLQAL